MRKGILACGAIVTFFFLIYILNYSGALAFISGNGENVQSARSKLIETLFLDNTVEGDITDSQGNVILNPTHTYRSSSHPAAVPASYSYLLGHNSPSYGRTGIRSRCFEALYAERGTGKGGKVQLTTETELQNRAYSLLRDNSIDGAVVVLNNKTGEILACASREKTDYNAAFITEEEMARYNSINGFWLPHATSDQEAPGSVFKLLTAAAAIETGNSKFKYYDDGTFDTSDGTVIHNYGDRYYGSLSLQRALTKSVNTYFAELAVNQVGELHMKDVFERFLIGEDIELDFTTLKSGVTWGSEYLTAANSFGQGEIRITPLHMAMIGQALANDGEMLKPYIIKLEQDANGKTLYEGKTEKLISSTDKKTARRVCELAHNTALEVFPELCGIRPGLCVKTGTAQIKNATINHSYFLAFDSGYTVLLSVNDTYFTGSEYDYVISPLMKLLNQIDSRGKA